jgi:hypothetical protein
MAADVTTSSTAAPGTGQAPPPVQLPQIPLPTSIPIPMSGDTLTVALWAFGMACVLLCSPLGQKIGDQTDAALVTLNTTIGKIVSHVEQVISNLRHKAS